MGVSKTEVEEEEKITIIVCILKSDTPLLRIRRQRFTSEANALILRVSSSRKDSCFSIKASDAYIEAYADNSVKITVFRSK